MITGQLNFLGLNIAASLAPISLVYVFFQTNPFWTSMIAFFALGEPLFKLELLAMFICFSSVIVIATQ